MATVLLPGSLLALFPGVGKRHEVTGTTVAEILDELEARVPGMHDRLVEAGPRLRRHINVFVDGVSGDLTTGVPAGATVHVIPAVSGGA
jgi:molybdopterin synthase sulfur carrier subunit